VAAPNSFYNCRIGVYSKDYYHIKGNNSYMITTQDKTINPNSGYFGYEVQSSAFDTANLNYNNITNVANGIAFTTTYGGGYIVYSGGLGLYYPEYQVAGNVNVSNNNINAALSTTAAGNTFLSYGIAVQNTINSIGPFGETIYGNVSTNNNIILGAYRGILASGYWMQPVTSWFNTITIKGDPTANAVKSYGINHTDCSQSEILANNVTGADATAMSDSVRAYYAASDTHLNIGCNTSSGTGRGFEFFQNNPGTWWHRNEMANHNKGFVLNGATIGQQGYTNHPNNNDWSSSSTWTGASHYQTFVYNGATPSSSILYVHGTTGTPSNNGGGAGFNYSISAGTIVSTGTSAPTTIECPPYFPDLGNTHVSFARIAQRLIQYDVDSNQQNWFAQFAAWQETNVDTMLMDSSDVMVSFQLLASHSRYAYLSDIENALYAVDTFAADSLMAISMSAFAATDTATHVQLVDDSTADYIVDNYKTFYKVYLDYIGVGLTSADSAEVQTLAAECPNVYGPIVYRARALYTAVFNDLREWNDDSCAAADTTTAHEGERHSKPHPNPLPFDFAHGRLRRGRCREPAI